MLLTSRATCYRYIQLCGLYAVIAHGETAIIPVLCIMQDWRPFNSRQWLGNYLLDHAVTQPVGPELTLQAACEVKSAEYGHCLAD